MGTAGLVYDRSAQDSLRLHHVGYRTALVVCHLGLDDDRRLSHMKRLSDRVRSTLPYGAKEIGLGLDGRGRSARRKVQEGAYGAHAVCEGHQGPAVEDAPAGAALGRPRDATHDTVLRGFGELDAALNGEGHESEQLFGAHAPQGIFGR
jgi:hypothetical protein